VYLPALTVAALEPETRPDLDGPTLTCRRGRVECTKEYQVRQLSHSDL